MRVAVTGASGLIGSALVPALREDGHEVLRLVRRVPSAADEVEWEPMTGIVDTEALAGVEGVIHLAGAGLGDRRWTEAYKQKILRSRVDGTRTIARAMTVLDPLPRVLVAGSGIGYYGDTGDRVVDEHSPKGDDFLSDVVEQWEAAADPAREAGIRVVHSRTGLVVARGGTWGRLTPLFQLGFGGRMGDGRQYWPFIAIEDEVRALIALLTDERYAGPVNLVAPNPVTNTEMAEAMGRVLRRPTFIPAPAFALRLVLADFAEAVLTGQRAVPRELETAGFTFRHPTFEDAYRATR